MILDAPGESLARLRALQSPDVRARLDLMQRVKVRFLHTQRYDAISAVFDELLDDLTLCADPKLPDGAGNRREGAAMVLVAESGAGKTFALKRLVGRHPAFPGYCVPRSGCAATYVRVPASSTYKAVARITLRELGLPIKGNPPAHIIWEKVYERLEGLGVLVLHFDEMHNLLKSATDEELSEMRNVVKTLVTSPSWPIVVIISGLPEVINLTQPIDEIRRRCKHFEFSSLRLPDDIALVEHAILDLAGITNLRLDTTEHEALVPRLIHAALYQLGTSIELSHEAIDVALKGASSSLNREHYATAFAGRTGCAAPDNPFLAPKWVEVDCTRILGKGRSVDMYEEPITGRKGYKSSVRRQR